MLNRHSSDADCYVTLFSAARKITDLLAQWRSGKVFDLRSICRGFNSLLDKAVGKLFTPICLCHHGITWYWSKDGDVFQLER